MTTIKEHIEQGHYPRDDKGRALVPMRGGESKIIVTHVLPPIPLRTHDYSAHYDGYEQEGPIGYGSTEAEALAELLELSETQGEA